MLPSLSLASRLLDEPQILTYIKGFLKWKLDAVNDDEATKDAGQLLHTFQPALLDACDSESTWYTLWNLKDHLTLQFSSKLPNGCVAVTGPADQSANLPTYSWISNSCVCSNTNLRQAKTQCHGALAAMMNLHFCERNSRLPLHSSTKSCMLYG
jgi:hypothetical protein